MMGPGVRSTILAGPAEFAAIANGSVDAASARRLVENAIGDGGKALDYVCAALRDATFRLVAATPRATGIPQWHDLMLHASKLALREGRIDASAKLSGFAELIEQTARFQDRHPEGEISGRPSVQQVLASLSGKEAPTAIATIVSETGMAEVNLSRLLLIIEVHGLIVRRCREGKVLVELTQAGRDHVNASQARP